MLTTILFAIIALWFIMYVIKDNYKVKETYKNLCNKIVIIREYKNESK